MMRTMTMVGVAVLAVAALAAAEDPVVGSMKFLYENAKTNAIASATKADPALYDFKPADETRTFGQQLAHIADANYLFCSTSRGETNPYPGAAPGQQGTLEKSLMTKKEIVDAVKASFAYCDEAFVRATDAGLTELVELETPSGTMTVPRASVLTLALYHAGHHYGSLAVYFRLNGIVPPSTEADLERQRTQ